MLITSQFFKDHLIADKFMVIFFSLFD